MLFNDARAIENLERSLPERGEVVDDSDVTFLYYAGEPAVSVAKNVVDDARRVGRPGRDRLLKIASGGVMAFAKTCGQDQDGLLPHVLRLRRLPCLGQSRP